MILNATQIAFLTRGSAIELLKRAGAVPRDPRFWGDLPLNPDSSRGWLKILILQILLIY